MAGVLNQTPWHRMCDAAGRPYFSWDSELTLADWQALVRDPDPAVAGWYIARLMRQARPDDVFLFVSLHDIAAHWAGIEPHLGQARPFWRWILGRWGVIEDGGDGTVGHPA